MGINWKQFAKGFAPLLIGVCVFATGCKSTGSLGWPNLAWWQKKEASEDERYARTTPKPPSQSFGANAGPTSIAGRPQQQNPYGSAPGVNPNPMGNPSYAGATSPGTTYGSRQPYGANPNPTSSAGMNPGYGSAPPSSNPYGGMASSGTQPMGPSYGQNPYQAPYGQPAGTNSYGAGPVNMANAPTYSNPGMTQQGRPMTQSSPYGTSSQQPQGNPYQGMGTTGGNYGSTGYDSGPTYPGASTSPAARNPMPSSNMMGSTGMPNSGMQPAGMPVSYNSNSSAPGASSIPTSAPAGMSSNAGYSAPSNPPVPSTIMNRQGSYAPGSVGGGATMPTQNPYGSTNPYSSAPSATSTNMQSGMQPGMNPYTSSASGGAFPASGGSFGMPASTR